MKYQVKVTNKAKMTLGLVITDVEEEDVGEVVTRWCGSGSTVIVTPQEEEV